MRYRKHAKTPAGRPDLVFLGPRVAVFIDGCFWHGCPDHYVAPRSRVPFWSAKLLENVERDTRQTLQLEALGWRVCRFWEHEVYERLDEVVERVQKSVHIGSTNFSPEWRVYRVVSVDETGDLEQRYLRRLRFAETTMMLQQKRHTKKWKRPSSKTAASKSQTIEG
ncbi:MAG: DNA mismatch endonuclease (patch repair protein) [Myxococcota bacterium]|jgi:DNA mismatch endonuclease (patch repair protein)